MMILPPSRFTSDRKIRARPLAVTPPADIIPLRIGAVGEGCCDESFG